MKKYLMILLGMMLAVGTTSMAIAGEHGGKEHSKEHGGEATKAESKEHGGAAVKAATPPTKDDIRNAMKSYVEKKSADNGGKFAIEDPDTGKTLMLTMKRVHERVGKTGDYYYSCADFSDDQGGAWDLDIDVADKNGHLSVVDVRVHKESGDPSYTYDNDDNRHPLKDGTKRHLGMHKGSMNEHGGAEHKGSGKEHGGKEHGGN